MFSGVSALEQWPQSTIDASLSVEPTSPPEQPLQTPARCLGWLPAKRPDEGGGESSREEAPCIDALFDDEKWAWSRNDQLADRDLQYINPQTVFFHPSYAFGTSAALGERPLTKYITAYWEVEVKHVYGTSMMFGIGKRSTKLSSPTLFVNLIGQDADSYGLSHRGILYHRGEVRQYCEPLQEQCSASIGVYFNGPARTLAFFINGHYMGVAFDHVELEWDDFYYPMISSTSQRSCFSVSRQKYRATVRPLAEQCMLELAGRLKSLKSARSLGLPTNLATFLEACISKQRDLHTSHIEQNVSKPTTMDPNLVVKLVEMACEYRSRGAWASILS